MTPPRIAIVDDHRLLLTALTEWMRNTEVGLDVRIAVPTWPELLTSREFPVDAVLLDLDLKDGIPISLKVATLKQSGVACVLMSTYAEPSIVREAIAAGALGYLVKSEDADRIAHAIRGALRGEPYISPELDMAMHASDDEAPHLSAQERRVMALYAGGQPVKGVAQQLAISDETAKSYLKRVREKYRSAGVDISTKVSLRKQALRDGIIIESN